MELASALPQFLIDRYTTWKSEAFEANRELYSELSQGQSPSVMAISCCDSRVLITSMFGVDPGEFFLHRNIANLVPPAQLDGQFHGTSAALEFGITALKVSHLLVVGHSSCGGINGCIQMSKGNAPELEKPGSFIGRWLEILRPACHETAHIEDAAERQTATEKRAVVTSLKNLMGFDFVVDAVKSGDLTLHGLWTDIGSGTVEVYDPETDAFSAI